jgi:hypothetical protein
MVFDIVLLQERDEFFLKTDLLVMLDLTLDVGDGSVLLGNAHSKCAITRLPREVLSANLVDVIVSPTDCDRLHAVLLCDATEICPESWLQGSVDAFVAFFGGKNTMIEAEYAGVCHAIVSESSCIGARSLSLAKLHSSLQDSTKDLRCPGVKTPGSVHGVAVRRLSV